MGTAVNIEVCPSNMKSFAFLASHCLGLG